MQCLSSFKVQIPRQGDIGRVGLRLVLLLVFDCAALLYADRDYYENPELDEEDRYRLVEYHKWMFDLSLFIPLNKKFVVNTRAHLGFIGTYTDATDSGPYERFFLGGNGLNGANNFVIGLLFIHLLHLIVISLDLRQNPIAGKRNLKQV